MLSGIGPEEHLKTHGIKVKANLPGVGQKFMDHPEIPIVAYYIAITVITIKVPCGKF